MSIRPDEHDDMHNENDQHSNVHSINSGSDDFVNGRIHEVTGIPTSLKRAFDASTQKREANRGRQDRGRNSQPVTGTQLMDDERTLLHKTNSGEIKTEMTEPERQTFVKNAHDAQQAATEKTKAETKAQEASVEKIKAETMAEHANTFASFGAGLLSIIGAFAVAFGLYQGFKDPNKKHRN